jgi:hypothetical protein
MDNNFRANHGEQPSRDAWITRVIRVFAVRFITRGNFPKWGEDGERITIQRKRG